MRPTEKAPVLDDEEVEEDGGRPRKPRPSTRRLVRRGGRAVEINDTPDRETR